MQFIIDTVSQTLSSGEKTLPLYSKEAFSLLSDLWLKVGWNARYHYTFTWLGRPILQLPEDILRLQEVIWELKPDVIIETGIALGGSILFYASLCKMMEKGRVIGIDIDLRLPNRTAIQEDPLAAWITLIDGSSIDQSIFKQVSQEVASEESVFIILDSNHSKAHVAKELELYSKLVTKGSYIVVSDGFKKMLSDVPRGKKAWEWDNPATAVCEFVEKHPEFVLESPERRYNRSDVRENVTHFMDAWLKKVI